MEFNKKQILSIKYATFRELSIFMYVEFVRLLSFICVKYGILSPTLDNLLIRIHISKFDWKMLAIETMVKVRINLEAVSLKLHITIPFRNKNDN